MKNIIAALLIATVSCSTGAYAKIIHCEAKYKNKAFVQATIWSGIDGFGPAECDYKNPKDTELISYKFPEQDDYYTVSGNWESTMPGYQWCSVQNGNDFKTCLFAKREGKN
jgi:hypothetical protein